MNASQYLHIVSIFLGAAVLIAGLYMQQTLADAIGIVIVAVNSAGAYLGGTSGSSPGSVQGS